MPISDQEGYPEGHFTKVYNQIIKPSIDAAGYISNRADEEIHTHMIHATIIRKLIEAPMAVCDLSSKNPNVMFELGIRQAYNMPVVLIQDKLTPRIFDVGGLNTLEYESSREYDCVMDIRQRLTEAIKGNSERSESLISLVDLLPAKKEFVKTGGDADKIDLILGIISQLNSRINKIDYGSTKRYLTGLSNESLPNIIYSARERTMRLISNLSRRMDMDMDMPISNILDEIEKGYEECRSLELILQKSVNNISISESELFDKTRHSKLKL